MPRGVGLFGRRSPPSCPQTPFQPPFRLLCAALGQPNCGRYPQKTGSEPHNRSPPPRSFGWPSDLAVASLFNEGLWSSPEAGPGSGCRPPPPPVLSKRPALLIFVGGLGGFPSPPFIPSGIFQVPVVPRPPQTLSIAQASFRAHPPILSISRARSLQPFIDKTLFFFTFLSVFRCLLNCPLGLWSGQTRKARP